MTWGLSALITEQILENKKTIHGHVSGKHVRNTSVTSQAPWCRSAAVACSLARLNNINIFVIKFSVFRLAFNLANRFMPGHGFYRRPWHLPGSDALLKNICPSATVASARSPLRARSVAFCPRPLSLPSLVKAPPAITGQRKKEMNKKEGGVLTKKKKGALSDYVFDEWKIVIYQLQTIECEGRPPGSKRTAVMCCSRLSDRPKLECFAVFYRVVVQKWRGTFGCRIQLCQVHRLQNVQPWLISIFNNFFHTFDFFLMSH